VPSFTTVSARISFNSEDRKWSAALSAENVFDKFYWITIGPERNNTDNSVVFNRSGVPARGREIALTLRRNFD
jgi:outer membrane receptor protein involved in Fe transport